MILLKRSKLNFMSIEKHKIRTKGFNFTHLMEITKIKKAHKTFK